MLVWAVVLRIFVVCMDTASVALLLMLVCVFSLCWVLVMVAAVVVVVLMVVVVFLLATWTAVLVVVLWWLLMVCLLLLVHMLVICVLLAFLQVSGMVHVLVLHALVLQTTIPMQVSYVC